MTSPGPSPAGSVARALRRPAITRAREPLHEPAGHLFHRLRRVHAGPGLRRPGARGNGLAQFV